MARQLAAIDLQKVELRKEQDEKLAAILAQKQADRLKEWANQYLSDMANGLRVLETSAAELDEEERGNLYGALGANRFEEKYDGDRLAALQWAILEEKRRTVRMIVSKVLLVKGQDGSKRIIPQLAFDTPPELASLAYDDQSLAYVEQARFANKAE